jgi:hypothetical protein
LLSDRFAAFPGNRNDHRRIADLLSQAANAQDSYVEPAYRNSDGTLATEGAWNLPCRVDAIPVSEDSAEPVVDSQTRLDFEPIHFRLGDSAVELQPFVWDWLSLEVQGLAEEKASNALIDWFNDWFDGMMKTSRMKRGCSKSFTSCRTRKSWQEE